MCLFYNENKTKYVQDQELRTLIVQSIMATSV
jgi:hypothetical protein